MKRDEALKLADNALAQLAMALENGHSETLSNYLATLGRFHNYSFGNVMLIACQKPEATHVAGFATWKKLGRYVKKGEKGIAILAPLVYRSKRDDASLTPDNDDEQGKRLCGFKVVHVFDVTQTEGEEMPEFAKITGTPGECLPKVRELIHSHGIQLAYSPIPGGALGTSAGGAITIQPGLDEPEEFSVLVHELAHELLHKGERRTDTSKTIRETEAEAVAFVVAQAIGLDCSTRSSDYIQLYRGDKETLSESLDHIQKTAATIIEALQPAA